MISCANIDPVPQGAKAAQFAAEVEAALARGWSAMLRSEERLLPAHLAAQLEPIAKKSAELAALLLRLPVELRFMVARANREKGLWLGRSREATGTINDTAYEVVSDINTKATLLIAQLREVENRGFHRKVSSSALKDALTHLGGIFDSFAADPSPEDRRAFLKICRRYLPKGK
jgi:hypothetical protein